MMKNAIIICVVMTVNVIEHFRQSRVLLGNSVLEEEIYPYKAIFDRFLEGTNPPTAARMMTIGEKSTR